MVLPRPPLHRRDLDHCLARSEGAMRELSGGRLLVTGGTGFFGRWLLETFAHAQDRLALGATMVVLTRDPGAFLASAPHMAGRGDVSFVTGDVRTFEAKGPFSHVLHCATATSQKANEESPEEMIGTTVDGTRTALAVAEAGGATRFLLTSSGAVYGPQPPEITHLPETYGGGPDPLDPRSAYAEGKRIAELLCALAGRRRTMGVVVARAFAFVGPHLPIDAHFAIGNFIGDALAGRAVVVGGDGTPYRSYLYAADLAVWLWTLLVRGAAGRAYNVGSEHDARIADFARAVAHLEGAEVEVRGVAAPGRPPARYVPSTARVRSELGLEEAIGLEEALRRTLSWHRDAAPGGGRR